MIHFLAKTNNVAPSPQSAGEATPGVAGTTLRPSQGGYAAFVQQANPSTKPPTKGEFYQEQFRENFVPSYRRTSKRYFDSLKEHPSKVLGVGLLSTALAVPMLVFQRTRGILDKDLIQFLFIFTMLGYPIFHANKNFPKLVEAYEQVEKGNPTQGKETFRNALDESFYRVYHCFLKPFSFAMMLATVIRLPKIIKPMAGEQLGWVDMGIQKTLKLFRCNGEGAISRQLNRFSDFLANQGLEIEKRVNQVPVLNRFFPQPPR